MSRNTGRIAGLNASAALLALWCMTPAEAVPLEQASSAADMVEAAKEGYAETVRDMLNQGMPINATDGAGATALAFAVLNRNQDLIGELLKSGADPNLVNDYGVGPLLIATKGGQTALVRQLLERRANPNAAMWTGETPLMFASRLGDADMVKALIDAGAEVNAREPRRGQSALMWAAAAGKVDAVRLLLAAKADVAAATPAVKVKDVYSDGLTTEAVLTLNRGGITPLMFAVSSENAEVVKLLLDAGAEVNHRSADGTSALTMSLYHHKDALPTFPYDNRITGDIVTAKLLLDRGADPNLANDYGLSPLAVTAFLALGHDLRGQTDGKDDIAYHFQDSDAEAAATLLLAKGADPNLMVVDYRPPVPPGADIRFPSRFVNVTPFLLAAAFKKPALVQLMMASGRIDVKHRLKNGDTLLIAAARLNGFSAVKALVEAGADVNAVNNDGDTALHFAAGGPAGAGEMIDFLLKKGARLTVRNHAGATPLSVAQTPEPARIRGGLRVLDPAKVAAGVPMVQIYGGVANGIPASPGPTGRAFIAALKGMNKPAEATRPESNGKSIAPAA